MATKPVVRSIARPAGTAVARPPNKRDFFVYAAPIGALAVGASSQVAVQVQADAAFELQKLSFVAVQTVAGTVDPVAQLTVQITDSGTGRSLFSAPIAIASVFGTGEIPFILPTSKLFSENASIVVAVTNVHATLAYASVRMSLIGTKIFRF